MPRWIPENIFWEELRYAKDHEIRFKTGLQLSILEINHIDSHISAWQKLVFTLQIGDPFFLNLDSVKRGRDETTQTPDRLVIMEGMKNEQRAGGWRRLFVMPAAYTRKIHVQGEGTPSFLVLHCWQDFWRKETKLMNFYWHNKIRAKKFGRSRWCNPIHKFVLRSLNLKWRLIFISSLKVVGNEKVGGSRRWHMIDIGLGPWW
jgi:hypothetical protein